MCKETRSHAGEYDHDVITKQETYRAIWAWREAKKVRNKALKEIDKNAKSDKPLNTFMG